MNQSHRMGWSGLAPLVALWNPETRVDRSTKPRIPELAAWREGQRALDVSPKPVEITFDLAAGDDEAPVADVPRRFKPGDRVRFKDCAMAGEERTILSFHPDPGIHGWGCGWDFVEGWWGTDACLELVAPAKPAAGDGWVEWCSTEARCPVPQGTLIEVRLRQPDHVATTRGNDYTRPGKVKYWLSEGSGCDIVAYRVLPA